MPPSPRWRFTLDFISSNFPLFLSSVGTAVASAAFAVKSAFLSYIPRFRIAFLASASSIAGNTISPPTTNIATARAIAIVICEESSDQVTTEP
jgi:hypothetical protein